MDTARLSKDRLRWKLRNVKNVYILHLDKRTCCHARSLFPAREPVLTQAAYPESFTLNSKPQADRLIGKLLVLFLIFVTPALWWKNV